MGVNMKNNNSGMRIDYYDETEFYSKELFEKLSLKLLVGSKPIISTKRTKKIEIISGGIRAGKTAKMIEIIRKQKTKVFEHRDITKYCKIPSEK